MRAQHAARPADPLDLVELDSLLTPDERAVRDAVRTFCDPGASSRTSPSGSSGGRSRTSAGSPRKLGQLGLLGIGTMLLGSMAPAPS
ncbi:hypothetical protein ACFYO0_13060 [Streptomyces sp. NPDC006365]|uniref:hypothetical protein n=1 Tax=Streptomyces sp. NPDC006365 TaxID=3364744 RepID=UPI0036CC67DD